MKQNKAYVALFTLEKKMQGVQPIMIPVGCTAKSTKLGVLSLEFYFLKIYLEGGISKKIIFISIETIV